MMRIITIMLLLVVSGCKTANLANQIPHVIHVEGAVKYPGEYPLQKHMTLVNALVLSQDSPSFSEIHVFRDGKLIVKVDGQSTRKFGFEPDDDIYLKHNDRIIVLENR